MAPAPLSSAGIGIANLPNQRHKIVAKRGANFTLMVVGESGLGKTTFINTLFTTSIKDYKEENKRHNKQLDRTVEIEITKAELEEKMFNVKLTVIDTPGFGDYINNRDSWLPIIDFIDDQHENYMRQEQQPTRKGIKDLRVHACLYFIRPTGHTLKPLDIEIMKRLGSRVNLIPVIAKADTLAPADLANFKRHILEVIAAQNIRIYTCPIESDDESSTQRNMNIMAAMPFALIGSTEDVVTPDGRRVKGRQYSWGVAEVENDDHCDFKKLRSLLVRTHMLDLINTTEEVHYELYRQGQMETRKFGDPKVRTYDNPKFKEEEDALRKRFTEQVKLEENRFRQWEQQLIAERDRLNKDLETQHSQIKALEQELESMMGQSPKSLRKRLSYVAPLVQHWVYALIAPTATQGAPITNRALPQEEFVTHLDTAAASSTSSDTGTHGVDIHSASFWGQIVLIILLVICSGIFAGLTLGLMSLDETNLRILAQSGTEKDKRYAARIAPIRKNGHLLLVTLVLAAVVINETLPIIFDNLFGGGYIAIIASTVLLVIFSEIIPQAVCSRHGLTIGAFFAWPVRILIWALFIFAWPVSKILDWCLGESHGVLYRRAELKELIALHGASELGGGYLNRDAITIVQGALDFHDKTVRHAMTSIDKVFMLPHDQILNRQCLNRIVRAGHSRIPVWDNEVVGPSEVDGAPQSSALDEKHPGEIGTLVEKDNGPDRETTLFGDSTLNKQVTDAEGNVIGIKEDMANVMKGKQILGVLLVKNLVLLDPDDNLPMRNMKINKIPTVNPEMSLFDMLNAFQEGKSHMAVVRGPVNPPPSPSTVKDKDDDDASTHSGSSFAFSHIFRFHHDKSEDSIAKPVPDNVSKKSVKSVDHKHDSKRPALEEFEEKAPATVPTTQDLVDQVQPPPEGQVFGIITLEDVLEELIQEEIYDETDHVKLNSLSMKIDPTTGQRYIVAAHRLRPGDATNLTIQKRSIRPSPGSRHKQGSSDFETQSLDETGPRSQMLRDERIREMCASGDNASAKTESVGDGDDITTSDGLSRTRSGSHSSRILSLPFADEDHDLRSGQPASPSDEVSRKPGLKHSKTEPQTYTWHRQIPLNGRSTYLIDVARAKKQNHGNDLAPIYAVVFTKPVTSQLGIIEGDTLGFFGSHFINDGLQSIALAVFLFIGGSVLIIVGALIKIGCITQQEWLDKGIPFLVLGSLMFVPGAYHVYIAYYAWYEYPGSSGQPYYECVPCYMDYQDSPTVMKTYSGNSGSFEDEQATEGSVEDDFGPTQREHDNAHFVKALCSHEMKLDGSTVYLGFRKDLACHIDKSITNFRDDDFNAHKPDSNLDLPDIVRLIRSFMVLADAVEPASATLRKFPHLRQGRTRILQSLNQLVVCLRDPADTGEDGKEAVLTRTQMASAKRATEKLRLSVQRFSREVLDCLEVPECATGASSQQADDNEPVLRSNTSSPASTLHHWRQRPSVERYGDRKGQLYQRQAELGRNLREMCSLALSSDQSRELMRHAALAIERLRDILYIAECILSERLAKDSGSSTTRHSTVPDDPQILNFLTTRESVYNALSKFVTVARAHFSTLTTEKKPEVPSKKAEHRNGHEVGREDISRAILALEEVLSPFVENASYLADSLQPKVACCASDDTNKDRKTRRRSSFTARHHTISFIERKAMAFACLQKKFEGIDVIQHHIGTPSNTQKDDDGDLHAPNDTHPPALSHSRSSSDEYVGSLSSRSDAEEDVGQAYSWNAEDCKDCVKQLESRDSMENKPSARVSSTGTDTNIMYNKEGYVIGCTAEKFIELLTRHHRLPDPMLVKSFFHSFRLFMTPVNLVKLLTHRFEYPLRNLPEDDMTNVAMLELAVAVPVRIRVCNLIKIWMESYFNFETDYMAEAELMELATNVVVEKLPKEASRLTNLIRDHFETRGPAGSARQRLIYAKMRNSEQGFPESPQKPSSLDFGKPYTELSSRERRRTIMSNASQFSKSIQLSLARGSLTVYNEALNLFDTEPSELARQLTLIESTIFCEIQPNELIFREFDKAHGYNEQSQVRRMVSLSTNITSWVQSCILQEADTKKRAAIIKYFIKICEHLLGLNNFNTLMAVRCALDSSAILRLKKTWELISARHRLALDEVIKITGAERNFAEYRRRLSDAGSPCLPFLGLYLTDLTFINEGNHNYRLTSHGTELINVDKFVKISRILDEVQAFQLPYPFQEDADLQKLIMKALEANNYDMQQLYAMSLRTEPKDQASSKRYSIMSSSSLRRPKLSSSGH
ncbi:hypothetical protein BZG36_05059 [Bifiguratus adelaidae]|uniref:Septin-type G domain-containing protein n=1 Tax=Bifiguratus adelaidae TaxID=1938954 RepID=A0A261XUS2_9FUNG|nr:hypothetical protein BZG36_05059 [Bifiguratus adelaidae]